MRVSKVLTLTIELVFNAKFMASKVLELPYFNLRNEIRFQIVFIVNMKPKVRIRNGHSAKHINTYLITIGNHGSIFQPSHAFVERISFGSILSSTSTTSSSGM